MSASVGPGAFVAVVGASGTGKDSVIAWAMERVGDAGVLLARRWITRPAGAGEDHLPVEPATFAAAERRGAFAVSWRAHGLAYGVPGEVDAVVRDGRVVVANVSRGAVDELRGRYLRLRVVRITVSDELRAARIAARGRESGEAVLSRLTRPDPAPEAVADLEICNDGPLAEAGERFAEFLLAVRGGA